MHVVCMSHILCVWQGAAICACTLRLNSFGNVDYQDLHARRVNIVTIVKCIVVDVPWLPRAQ